MYLQITTKCNMKCQHCGFSCNKNGKHGNFDVILDCINFIGKNDDYIAIGGGEPTLHPHFFTILNLCLNRFDCVWFATNGSKTHKMLRISDIISGYDEEIYQQNKLSVALSLDYFHDPIDKRIIEIWKSRSKSDNCYEIRSVEYSHLISSGRARKISGTNEDACICSDIFILPTGKIKLCGCEKSPIIGNVWSGFDPRWEDIIQNDEKYLDSKCYKNLK